ncbi:ABC transporter ATP-binding protein [Myxococcus landrumensis]|uniref:ABC transporter ATP-binding protein n=1 Tax=Myxococcus landrumensis TaxID=2813577 RepID=A0ABX7NDY8_9BACT|nr:ABC transporter ATP-binding protein [Myxococcus landrumus]QSQ14513.1 ABC transporter ATP-binding protein [Myxococcus landrumus]
MAPVVQIEGVSFRYQHGDGDGLDDVSLTLEPGELAVVVGASGCGKTTLTRVVNGLVPRFFEGKLQGTVRINGQEVNGWSIGQIGQQVGSVFQDPRSQFFTTSATSEVAFASEHFGVPTDVMKERVDEAFERLGIHSLRGRSVFELSTGERQKVALASAYAMRPSVYVLDEPSANLDPQATRHLGLIIDMLRKDGAVVLVAEHRLYYLAGILDKLIHMRQGRIVEVFERAALHSLPSSALDARGLRQVDLSHARLGALPPVRRDDIYFQSHDVSLAFGERVVLNGVTAQASRGEVVGLIGRNGSGKTTFARVATGLLEQRTGRIRHAYKVVSAKQRRAASFFVLQDADYQLYTESVLDELLLGLPDTASTRRRAMETLARFDIERLASRHPQSLSGGQKQRLTIAVAAMRRADVLFLDEPTSGLDATNLQRVGEEIRLLADQGQVVFVISHDYELLAQCCPRILRLEGGRTAADYLLDVGSARRLRMDLDLPSARAPSWVWA